MIAQAASADPVGPQFTVRWPDDAMRMAPVPAGRTCRFIAAKPFALAFESATATAAEVAGEWMAELHLPPVQTVEERLVTWLFADGSLGRSWILPLPDAAELKTDHLICGPWAGKHGILANRRGASVQARGAWAKLESKYDAFLAANLDTSGPGDRRVVMPAVQMTLVLGHDRQEINGDAVAAFASGPNSLQWWFSMYGVRFTVCLTLGAGNAIRLEWTTLSPVAEDVLILIRPVLDDRSFHEVTKAFQGPEDSFRKAVTPQGHGFEFHLHDEHVVRIAASSEFRSDPQWNYCAPLPQEAGRGLEAMTDVFTPGDFVWQPAVHERFELTVTLDNDVAPATAFLASDPAEPFQTAMRRSFDLYLSNRSGDLTVIAGFPWFLDWGRDSLIFCRGLMAADCVEEAGSILRRFGSFEREGTLPNLLRGSEVTNRETSDAPLWWIVAANEWIMAGGDATVRCGTRSILEIMQSIATAYLHGTEGGVCCNHETGLIFSPAHFTWMDTDQPCGTPRVGYPIEIQALWITALRALELHDPGKWQLLAQQAATSLETLFWREDEGFFADCLHAASLTAPAVADDHLRPNQWLAIALGAVTNMEKARRALANSQCLLIPGAARSLAPRPVKLPLPVVWGDTTLNDPIHPYWPRYTGPENVSRKPAYHNGTGWCWQYPLYPEAMLRAWGEPARAAARSLMSASAVAWHDGCLGQLPEIVDGDIPHLQRGCGAQAWSISEWLRVWKLLGDSAT